ncbi:MAG: nicotinamide mononucleotide transporter [Bacteroidales bacterium]|nr:nicotinamide mononucleotide transporter [Bacteroidales bacterium]
MQKFKTLIKEEFSGWKPFDIIWLVTVCVVVTTISILFKYDKNTDRFYWIHIVASACGIINVVLGGKGKLSNYLFGFIHCCLMIYITLISKLYADMGVTVYNFIMQFVGFFTWSKNMSKETHEVKKNHASNKTRILSLVVIVVGTIAVGFIMKRFTNDLAPFADAAKAVMQVIAMILMVRMFSEQWWLWIAINCVSIFMYIKAGNFPITIMYVVYLVNSIIMCVRWEKEAIANDKLLK